MKKHIISKFDLFYKNDFFKIEFAKICVSQAGVRLASGRPYAGRTPAGPWPASGCAPCWDRDGGRLASLSFSHCKVGD